jgi:hypothetical protein
MVTEKDRVTDDLQKYIKKSQWDKAIQALDRLAELEPNNAAHRLRTGDYYLKLGATQKAVTAYHQAADVFTKGGFVVKALAAYKMVLRLDSQNKNAHEKMQGLHEQACELSQPYVIPAGARLPKTTAPVSETAAAVFEEAPVTPLEISTVTVEVDPVMQPPGAVDNTLAIPEPENEMMDEGLVGVQPFNLQEFGTGPKPPSTEPASPDMPFEIERTSYAASGGSVSEPSASGGTPASEPAPESKPPEQRPADVMPLFSTLTPDEFSEVVERMIHFQYPSGYRIVKEGDTGDSVYLISRGAVSVMTKVGAREIALSELKDNDFFGEVGFLTGRPRTASVITRTDTEVLELRGEDLRTIIKKYPRVREVLEGFYKTRVRDTLSKVKHTGP